MAPALWGSGRRRAVEGRTSAGSQEEDLVPEGRSDRQRDAAQETEGRNPLEHADDGARPRSERSDGGAITPKYSKAYARLKGKSTPDLKLTGAFQEAIFAKSTSKTFVLSSKDKKKPFLVNRYSDNIFGLNSNGVADVEKDQPFRSALIDNIINSILP